MKCFASRSLSRQSTMRIGGVPRAKSKWRQYLVTILVNIVTLIAGTTYGWSAPILPVLQSEDSPIGTPPITDGEASWLASIFCLSRIITLPVYMYSVDRLGCKITALLTAVPFIVSYAMLLFANSTSMLLWARFIGGIAAGGSGILAPSYTTDIAEDSNKGELNVIFAQSMNFGVVFVYVMGFYTSYTVLHASCIVMLVIFVAALLWFPESPMFLTTTGRTEDARKVLQWLRNDDNVEHELERMKVRAEEVLQKRKEKATLSEMTDRKMLRGLFICLGLTLNQQLSGISVILSFTVTIFQQAGSAMPPHVTTILLGVLQIFGTALSSLAVERVGRRALLLASDVIMTGCLLAVGAYFYLQALGWGMEALGWVPITGLSLYIVSIGMGLKPLPFTIATELVHPRHRSAVQTANVIMMSLSTFATTLSFVPLMNFAGQHACFWLYGASCALGGVCIFLTLPETKNRSIEDVLEQMGSDRFIHSVLTYKRTTDEVKDLPSVKTSTSQQDLV